MRKAVILANGAPPAPEVLRRTIAGAELILCADGGANAAWELGLTPHAIIGDLDSISAGSRAHFRGVPTVHVPEQDRTDTEKAVEYALARGPFEEITILGATEGRLDHVLGHLGLLRRFADRTRLVLEDSQARAFLVRGEARLDLPEGTTVSFFAISTPAEGVTTENLRYPLQDRTLVFGELDSISNVIERTPAWIRIRKGEVVVFAITRP